MQLRERRKLERRQRARISAKLREHEARAGPRANDKVAQHAGSKEDAVGRGDDGAIDEGREREAAVHEREVVPRSVAEWQRVGNCRSNGDGAAAAG